jgi:hypothetical protein
MRHGVKCGQRCTRLELTGAFKPSPFLVTEWELMLSANSRATNSLFVVLDEFRSKRKTRRKEKNNKREKEQEKG